VEVVALLLKALATGVLVLRFRVRMDSCIARDGM
jgi:hypothetical protein